MSTFSVWLDVPSSSEAEEHSVTFEAVSARAAAVKYMEYLHIFYKTTGVRRVLVSGPGPTTKWIVEHKASYHAKRDTE